jgi:hypothetical protein
MDIKLSKNYWSYMALLICYKLNFILHWNDIQLHALVKYGILITKLRCVNT